MSAAWSAITSRHFTPARSASSSSCIRSISVILPPPFYRLRGYPTSAKLVVGRPPWVQNPAARLSSERSCFSLTLCIIALCFTDSVACPGQEKQPSP